MDLWTFIIIIVLINMVKDIIIKKNQNKKFNNTENHLVQEIDDLKQRIEELEKLSTTAGMEKRIQALETIVTDGDYCLEKKFRKAFGGDRTNAS